MECLIRDSLLRILAGLQAPDDPADGRLGPEWIKPAHSQFDFHWIAHPDADVPGGVAVHFANDKVAGRTV
jgi:hypothetical protein